MEAFFFQTKQTKFVVSLDSFKNRILVAKEKFFRKKQPLMEVEKQPKLA